MMPIGVGSIHSKREMEFNSFLPGQQLLTITS